jgi:SAM-dependent methyltransferase
MTPQSTYARFAKFYDAYTAGYDEDIPFYLAAVAGCKSPFLEVGCGSGRIMLPLLRAGHVVTGVDISKEMLDLAQQKLDAEKRITPSLNSRLLLHNFVKNPLPEKYGVALITFFTFNYIPPDDRIIFLENIRQSLTDNATIVMHLFYPTVLVHPELDGQWFKKESYQIDGEKVTLHDFRRMLNKHTEERCQRYTMRSGTSEEIKTVRYYLSPVDLAGLLTTSGFVDVRVGKDLQIEHLKSLAGLHEASGEYVVVAKKAD